VEDLSKVSESEAEASRLGSTVNEAGDGSEGVPPLYPGATLHPGVPSHSDIYQEGGSPHHATSRRSAAGGMPLHEDGSAGIVPERVIATHTFALAALEFGGKRRCEEA